MVWEGEGRVALYLRLTNMLVKKAGLAKMVLINVEKSAEPIVHFASILVVELNVRVACNRISSMVYSQQH